MPDILGKCGCIYPVEKRDLLTVLKVDIIQSENRLKELNDEYNKGKDVIAKTNTARRIAIYETGLEKSKRLRSKIENTPECETHELSLL